MAATPGYHGFEQTLDTDNTYETIFTIDADRVPERGVFGMEFECSGSNAEIVFNTTAEYGSLTDHAVTIKAGNAPTRFYFDRIQHVKARFATVSGATLTWRTVGA